ncbi:hypothetical protein, partial [Camelimonas fluminis]|uniref:hypothetical protein n=1 Tax=Camelimonas fluminis TaxID=1576911 RepID=UPI001FCE3D5A
RQSQIQIAHDRLLDGEFTLDFHASSIWAWKTTPWRAPKRHLCPLWCLIIPVQQREILLLSKPARTASIAEGHSFSSPLARHVEITALEVGCSPENFPWQVAALPAW